VVGELKEAVEAHGFGAMIEGHDLSLHAFDRQREHCMLFYQDERPLPQTEESGYLTSRAGFAVVFDVVIDGCGAYYPS